MGREKGKKHLRSVSPKVLLCGMVNLQHRNASHSIAKPHHREIYGYE